MKKLFIHLAMFVGAAFSFGQQAQGQAHKVLVDKIVAVVGDRIVLQSDITNQLADMARNNDAVTPNTACDIMERTILSKILVLQAEKDSLPLTDEDVDGQLDLRIRDFIRYYGTQQAVEDVAGKTIFQLKEDFKPQIREQMLAQKMQGKLLENVHITPSEVSAYFNRVPADSLPFLESELEVGQISLYPKADKSVEDYIYNEMLGYKKQIESGAVTFESLAKKVSEDPGSKDRGGLYEVSRSDKSTWDPAFMAGIFRLKQGEISLPVKSNKFGYFLIQLLERRGDNAKVRMILRTPPVTDNELDIAKKKLDSVRADITANKMSFKDAAYKYSDDETVKNYGPFILSGDGSSYVTIDRLDKDMIGTIRDMKVGDLSQPVAFTNEQGKKGVRLVYLKSRTEPHRLNLKDDYTKIAEHALAEKKNQEMDKWLSRNIPNYYIMVDDDAAKECSGLRKYNVSSTGF